MMDLTQLAVLGDSVEENSQYNINIFAENNSTYDLESFDITLSWNNKCYRVRRYNNLWICCS